MINNYLGYDKSMFIVRKRWFFLTSDSIDIFAQFIQISVKKK